jgi:hypothetical protein
LDDHDQLWKPIHSLASHLYWLGEKRPSPNDDTGIIGRGLGVQDQDPDILLRPEAILEGPINKKKRKFVPTAEAISGWLYLLRTREHLRLKEHIYKLGMTEDYTVRMPQYGVGSEILFIKAVNNIREAESEAKRVFREHFNSATYQGKSLGTESFEGNPDQMQILLFQITQRYSTYAKEELDKSLEEFPLRGDHVL